APSRRTSRRRARRLPAARHHTRSAQRRATARTGALRLSESPRGSREDCAKEGGGMSFLAPLFALGALAIIGPILFHLIRRTTREVTPFSTLMFLRPSPP